MGEGEGEEGERICQMMMMGMRRWTCVDRKEKREIIVKRLDGRKMITA